MLGYGDQTVAVSYWPTFSLGWGVPQRNMARVDGWKSIGENRVDCTRTLTPRRVTTEPNRPHAIPK